LNIITHDQIILTSRPKFPSSMAAPTLLYSHVQSNHIQGYGYIIQSLRTHLLKATFRDVQANPSPLQFQNHLQQSLQKYSLHLQIVNYCGIFCHPHLCLSQSTCTTNHQSLSDRNAGLWAQEKSKV